MPPKGAADARRAYRMQPKGAGGARRAENGAKTLVLDGQRALEPVGRAALGPDHVHHRVDERQVREGLREVAQVPAAARVDLLGVELQRARVRQQLLAQLTPAGDL